MKNLIPLQAVSSRQAYRGNLRVYVKDRIIGTWKASDAEGGQPDEAAIGKIE
jgi:hypothetical protein